MLELPRRTVTFLFTGIEESTALWERDRQAMATAVDHHLALPPGSYDVVHVNAEFADQASNHDPQVTQFHLPDS